MKTIGLGLTLALLCSACGSGDGDSGLCKSTMTTLCDMACDCTSGEGCNLGADQGATIYFDTRGDCLDWYVVLGCSQASKAPAGFFEGCATALETAACRTEGEEALLIPADCIAED